MDFWDVHVEISKTHTCFIYSKRDFEDVVELKIVKWEDYSVLPNCNLNSPYKRETGSVQARQKAM